MVYTVSTGLSGPGDSPEGRVAGKGGYTRGSIKIEAYLDMLTVTDARYFCPYSVWNSAMAVTK